MRCRSSRRVDEVKEDGRVSIRIANWVRGELLDSVDLKKRRGWATLTRDEGSGKSQGYQGKKREGTHGVESADARMEFEEQFKS